MTTDGNDDEKRDVADELSQARLRRLLNSPERTESRERFSRAMNELSQAAPVVSADDVAQWVEVVLRQPGFQSLQTRGYGVTVLVTTNGGGVKRVSTIDSPDALRAVLSRVKFP